MAQITRTSTLIGSLSPRRRISPDFEEAQQLHLDVLVEFAEFVEEQGAAVGDLEEALVVAVGAGERPLLVAEQLALDEVLRQRPAVDRDERHVGPLALRVERAGDDFLAGAGLAGDQHAAVGRADAVDELLHGQHRRAAADQPAGPSAACTRLSSAAVLCLSFRFSWMRSSSASISVSLHGLVR